jgi:hypothetical protein
MDLPSVAHEVSDLWQMIQSKDTSKIYEVLTKLAADGYKLGTDCYAALKEYQDN